jgi:hypothetical protein
MAFATAEGEPFAAVPPGVYLAVVLFGPLVLLGCHGDFSTAGDFGGGMITVSGSIQLVDA